MAENNSLLIKINGDAKNFADEIDKAKKETEDLGKQLGNIAKTSALAFAGFAASIALITKEFASYEKALVGVGKTTNIEGKRLDEFGKKFQKLSSDIPLSTNELLGIAQAAGQLGVSGEENLLKFTDTVAKLGVATDLAGEEGAIALTRILNVTGEAIDTIDTFGSVIVALGNNFAASESEIVRMTTEVSRSTAIFGVSAAEAAALSTALRSMGVQAQLGGSAVGRAFRTIDEVVRAGGAQLENLSRLTGLTGEQLKRTFEQDSNAVFQAFINGLGRVSESGGDVAGTLKAFGLEGDEINKVLPVLAKNAEIYAQATQIANAEVEDSTALNEEARKAFSTLDSELQRVNNNFTNIKTNIGEQLAPAVTSLLQSVNGLLKSISNLDSDTLGLIAAFLKWGAALTASLAAVATFAAGLLKLRALVRGLQLAFNAGRLAVVGFTSAATFGLSAVLAFLPEIIDGVTSLFDVFNKKNKTPTLDDINKKLERTKKLREDIANAPEVGFQGKESQLGAIDQEIKKLEELRQARIRAASDFGTGELLVRPTVSDSPLDFAPLFPDQTQIPLAGPEQATEAVKKSEEDKTAIVEEATQKRIEAARIENEALKEQARLRKEGLLNQDLDYVAKKAEIDKQLNEAQKIKNEEERQLALENINLKNEQELAAIAQQEARKDDLAAQRREERAALDEELRALDVEQQELFFEEDQIALQDSIDSQKEAEKKFANERLQARIRERNQFKQDEIKYGTEIAKLKEFFNKEEVKGFQDTSQNLAQLADSRNSTLKGIGKAAARVNAAIKTAEGAISAYASLSGIPIVGPALGAAAAAALVAYGVEQQQRISAAATGGFVPMGTTGGSRDRVPVMTEPGELIVPKAIAPNFIQAAGMPDTQAAPVGDQGQGNAQVEIVIEERASEYFTLQQREGRALGLIGA